MDRSQLVSLIDDPAPFLDDPDPAIRRLAASSCAGCIEDAGVVAALERAASTDPDPRVRARPQPLDRADVPPARLPPAFGTQARRHDRRGRADALRRPGLALAQLLGATARIVTFTRMVFETFKRTGSGTDTL